MPKERRNPRPCPVCGKVLKGKAKFEHIQTEHPELKLAYRTYESSGKSRQQLICMVCGKDTSYGTAHRHIKCPGGPQATTPVSHSGGRTDAFILEQYIKTFSTASLLTELNERFSELLGENESLTNGLQQIADHVRHFHKTV